MCPRVFAMTHSLHRQPSADPVYTTLLELMRFISRGHYKFEPQMCSLLLECMVSKVSHDPFHV